MSQTLRPSRPISGSESKSELTNFWQRVMFLPQPAMRVAVLVVSAALSALLLTVFGGALTVVEERVGAAGWTLFPDDSLEERITLVVIDEASVAEIGPWPWSRDEMAQLVSAIDDAGAQLQLHEQ